MNEKVIGPFTVELKVHVTGEDGAVFGAATVGLAPGRVPTLEAIHRAIGQTLAAVPDDLRLQNPDEFFGTLVKEKTGRRMKFATPGDFDYDLEALVASARAAYVPDDEPEPSSPEDHDEGGDDFWEDEE